MLAVSTTKVEMGTEEKAMLWPKFVQEPIIIEAVACTRFRISLRFSEQ